MAPPRAREVEGFDRTVGRSNRTVGRFDRAAERVCWLVAGLSRAVGWLGHAVENGGGAVEWRRRMTGAGDWAVRASDCAVGQRRGSCELSGGDHT